jgi:lipopolysaccharide assembly outer membrane protein LptD (OstA)
LEVKPITVETITQLIGLGNTASPEQKEKKTKGEKEERRIVFESLTQPLKRVGRKVYGADVTVREEGEDYTITVKHFTYDESKEYLVADGMVRYEDPDVILTAPKAELFRRERRLLLVGKVHLESKPRESPQNASAKNGSKSQQGGEEELPLRERIRRKPTVIDCEQLEYFYRERRAVAKGNLKFKHGQYAGSASTVTYWHREDKLLAEGKVVVNDLEEGHLFECTSVTILLANDERKEDEIIVAPGARALIKVKEEEEETKPSEEKTKQQEERKTPPKVEEKTKP